MTIKTREGNRGMNDKILISKIKNVCETEIRIITDESYEDYLDLENLSDGSEQIYEGRSEFAEQILKLIESNGR
mgnify:CR=1 FL=1